MKTAVWLRFVGTLGALPAFVSCGDERAPALGSSRDPVVWKQEVELLASDGAAEDNFGISASVSGDTALVGATGRDSYRGAAYVFVRSGASWSLQQTLTANDGASSEQFGYSAALSGNTAIVGALWNGSGRGAAYVFVRSGSSWSLQQKLTANDGTVGDAFGISVALSGDTAVVGAHENTSKRGAAYVFVRSGSSWSLQQKLTANDGTEGDLFGISAALSEDTAIVGAWTVSKRGAAYVFVRSGSAWSLQQKLTANDGASGDIFGTSVAVSGDTAVVGAPWSASKRGAAYVFVRFGSSWSPLQTLTASDGAEGDIFGTSVASSGAIAVVGASGKASGRGAAYVFVRHGSSWYPLQKLKASDGAEGDYFGAPVALSGNTAVMGAYLKASSRGAAYVFTPRSSDGAPCAGGAECASGHCTDGVCCKVAACPASDPCNDAACEPGTGVCSNTPRADGSPCDDGTCQSGVCEGSTTATGTGSTTTSTGGGSAGGAAETGAGGGAGDTAAVMDLSCRFSTPSTGRSGRPGWLGALALLALLRRRRHHR